jgi:hypothetical protein
MAKVKLTKKDLTLKDCTKAELIEIIQRMTGAFGSDAELFLELELLRTDALRMRAVVRDLELYYGRQS